MMTGFLSGFRPSILLQDVCEVGREVLVLVDMTDARAEHTLVEQSLVLRAPHPSAVEKDERIAQGFQLHIGFARLLKAEGARVHVCAAGNEEFLLRGVEFSAPLFA